MPCSQCIGIERQFDDGFARRELRRYRRKGPSKTTEWLLDAIVQEGIEGFTVLDIGGGVGVIQHELMARGATGGTSAEASPAYFETARSEALERGYADHVRYLLGDFVDVSRDIPPADVVTLDRVVCCYPDMPALVDAASERAARMLALVIPRDTWFVRLGVRLVNLAQRLRRHPFRVFLHDPSAVEERVERHGLAKRLRRDSLLWRVVVFTRPELTST